MGGLFDGEVEFRCIFIALGDTFLGEGLAVVEFQLLFHNWEALQFNGVALVKV